MKNLEIKKKIAQLDTASWYNNLEVNIPFRLCNDTKNIKGFSNIHKFYQKEFQGWEEIERLPGDLEQSKNHCSTMISKLEDFLVRHETYDENQLENIFRNQRNILESEYDYFLYNSPITNFLIDIYNNHNEYYGGAIQYIRNQNINYSKDYLTGAILAYEFLNKDSDITNRRNKEKASLTRLKNDFLKTTEEADQALSQHIEETNKKYKKFTEGIDKFQEDKENTFNEWFEGVNTEDSTVIGAKQKIQDLEDLYENKLKLSKPAEYWNQRAVILKGEGKSYFYWLIGVVIVACITLYFLLWKTPEGMLLSFLGGDKEAIKWSIVYITFISFLVYLVRVLSKLIFSSYHIARDAEEREQLTYFYLSLLKGDAVDDKDKTLIMQSLFSRSETGLLKDDSSPTMPNDFIGKIIK